MSREFKRLFGTSIINYQINCRITKAKELLPFSNLRIEEIAGQCGITDISYFNKAFHNMEKCQEVSLGRSGVGFKHRLINISSHSSISAHSIN